MKQWILHYWAPEPSTNSPIEKWLDKLDKEQFKSLTKELIMLEQIGNKLKLPHSSKALGKGLFELRERRFGLRAYYGFNGDLLIIVLATGDKQSQDQDIITARKRLSEINGE